MYRGKSWNYMETISPAGRSPLLSLSLPCVSEEKRFSLKVIQRRGAKKRRSAASCIGSKQIGQDPINSWKRRGAINDANGRSARIKKAAYERKVKSFFFSPPFFASSRPWTWTDFWSLFSGNEKRGGSVIDEINWRVWFFRRARSFWLIVRIFYERILNPSVPIDKDGIDNFYLPCDSTKQREEMELRRKKGGKEGRKEKLAQRE